MTWTMQKENNIWPTVRIYPNKYKSIGLGIVKKWMLTSSKMDPTFAVSRRTSVAITPEKVKTICLIKMRSGTNTAAIFPWVRNNLRQHMLFPHSRTHMGGYQPYVISPLIEIELWDKD